MTEEAAGITKPNNPLLGRIKLPGETFRIPSRGIFYTNGELDTNVKDGELHVYPMTTIDEITLRSPDKLFSGDGIKEVFIKCIPQIINTEEIFFKDIEFLMVALRKVTYGDEVEINFKHTCKSAKQHSYVVLASEFVKNTKYLDPLKIKEEYSLTLDNGQQVNFVPIKFKHALALVQAPKDEALEKKIIEGLAGTIASVDEVSDQEMIIEWLKLISAGWSEKISKCISSVSKWGVGFEYELTCKDCKETFKTVLPLNPISFFLTR